MRFLAMLALVFVCSVVLHAAPATSSPLHLILGVDRGTRRPATPNDTLVKVVLTARASDKSYECSESREAGAIECIFDIDAAGGEFSIRVVGPPEPSRGAWNADFNLPQSVSSVDVSGAINLVDDRRRGIMLGWVQVLVPADPLVLLDHSGQPSPSTESSLPILFKLRNDSQLTVDVESIRGKPTGRLFKIGEDGVSRRHVGPLDECFDPVTEYVTRVRPGADLVVADHSSREALTRGRYEFVVKYAVPTSRALIVGRRDRPHAEVRFSFEVK